MHRVWVLEILCGLQKKPPLNVHCSPHVTSSWWKTFWPLFSYLFPYFLVNLLYCYCYNIVSTSTQFWDNFGTNLRQLWDSFAMLKRWCLGIPSLSDYLQSVPLSCGQHTAILIKQCNRYKYILLELQIHQVVWCWVIVTFKGWRRSLVIFGELLILEGLLQSKLNHLLLSA